METSVGKKYLEYCKIRNKVRALTRTFRKEFEIHVANQKKKNPKAFWQYYKWFDGGLSRISLINVNFRFFCDLFRK